MLSAMVSGITNPFFSWLCIAIITITGLPFSILLTYIGVNMAVAYFYFPETPIIYACICIFVLLINAHVTGMVWWYLAERRNKVKKLQKNNISS